MKLRTAFLCLSFLLIVACQYTVPLSASHTIAIDPSLLGDWEMLPEQDETDASVDSFTLRKSSDTEYDLRYLSEGSEMVFRAYLIEAGGEQLMQLELLGSDKGALSEDDDKHRYLVARYKLNGSTLTVSTLNTALVSREINSTEGLLKAYLENKDNTDLFRDTSQFNRS